MTESQSHVSGYSLKRQRMYADGGADESVGDSGAVCDILPPTTTEETKVSVNASGDECQRERRRKPPSPLALASISAPSGVPLTYPFLTGQQDPGTMTPRCRHHLR
ncbi:MAG: hypothetical protein MJY59_03390 [Bacteroidaceae bacterium]|nr:hypothetical protein [Bacteroidaceae bacterium]